MCPFSAKAIGTIVLPAPEKRGKPVGGFLPSSSSGADPTPDQ